MCPLSGQKQASIGATLQVDVTWFPLASSPVQLVQWEVTLALAGLIKSARLQTRAAMVTSKSIFFFMGKFLSFCPVRRAMMNDLSALCGGTSGDCKWRVR